MAGRSQKVFYIEHSDLREKYHIQTKERVSSMCKAIGKYMQSQINVQVMPRGRSVRFEIIGKRAETTKEHILKEMCQPKSFTKHGIKGVSRSTEPVHSSQRAQKIMSKEAQDNILQDGIDPEKCYLLTEAALAKHNLLTGASELREFACGPCDHYWWRVVLITKPVSRCYGCGVKYDCLPREQEFGIGRYICQNKTCSMMFYRRCHATQAVTCPNCNSLVYNPYIHPRFRRSKQERKPIDPTMKPFEPPPPTLPKIIVVQIPFYLHGYPLGYLPATLPFTGRAPVTRKKKKVINPSTPHVSTGSTIDTFLTQSAISDLDVPVADPDSDSDEEVVCSDSSDSDSSSDDDSTPTQTEDELEVSSEAPTYPSDPDSDDDHPRHRKREVGSDSSDSSSDSDTDKDEPPSEVGSDKLSSQASTTLDSGLGTASNVETRSSIDSAKPISTGSQVSSGKFNPLRVTDIKPEYPGVLFSKKCPQKTITEDGNVILAEGLQVTVPSKAIPPGDEVPVTIQTCLRGPFKLPRDAVPMTPVYLLYPPCVFHRKVSLKFKVFADIDSEDQIIFVTSEDKPEILKDQPVWKFREDSNATVQADPGSREVTVEVGHFCFGILARRRRKDQNNFYMICLYTPSDLLPTCHAIFAAFLDHEMYKNNLETYLDKKYASEKFEESPHHTHLSEDSIQLSFPRRIGEAHITPDKTPCIIKKKVIDIPLKDKRYRQEISSTYPPRIVFKIQCDPASIQHPLKCLFEVKGIEEEDFGFLLSISPSRSPSLSSQRSSQSEASEGSTESFSITFEALIQRAGLSPELLDKECTDYHLRRIAHLDHNWLTLATNLPGVSEQDITQIRNDHQLEPAVRALRVLEKWHRSNSFMATYKKLIEVSLMQGDAVLASNICSIMKEPDSSEEI